MSGQEIKPYPPDALTALTTPVARLSVIACKLSRQVLPEAHVVPGCLESDQRLTCHVSTTVIRSWQGVPRSNSNTPLVDLGFPLFWISPSQVNPVMKWISQLPARVGAYVRSGHMA